MQHFYQNIQGWSEYGPYYANVKLDIEHYNTHNNWFYHLEGMSWYGNKFDPTQPDTGIDFGGTHPYKSLYDICENKKKYFKDVIEKQFNNVNIMDVFV